MVNVERAIIGALLIDPKRAADYLGAITPDMFTSDILGRAWFEIATAAKDGKELVTAELLLRLSDAYPLIAEQTIVDCVAVGTLSELDGNVGVLRKEHLARKVQEVIDHAVVTGGTVEQAAAEMLRDISALIGEKDDRGAIGVDVLAERLKDSFFTERTGRKIDIGIPPIDKAMGGIEGGDMVLIAARPAVGKSAFALQIVEQFAHDGLRVAYFNLEMRERQILERLIASAGGLKLERVRRGVEFLNDEKERFNKAMNAIKKLQSVFVFSGSCGVQDIRKAAHGYDVIVIDYLQLLKPDGKRTANRYAEVGDISHGLKAVAMDFNIPVIALSQINRTSSGGKEPNMSELRESGDLEQDASIILMMWEPGDDKGQKMLKVEKARQGYQERMSLTFDGSHMTFGEFEDADFDPFG